MTRSKRLEPVARLTQHRERDAARNLGQAQQTLDSYRERLRELQDYREEYLQRYQEAMSAGIMQGAPMQDYRSFLERINQAITQQSALVEAGERDYEIRRQSWLESRCKADAIEKAVARHRNREQHLRARLEQGESDEHAARNRRRGE